MLKLNLTNHMQHYNGLECEAQGICLGYPYRNPIYGSYLAISGLIKVLYGHIQPDINTLYN